MDAGGEVLILFFSFFLFGSPTTQTIARKFKAKERKREREVEPMEQHGHRFFGCTFLAPSGNQKVIPEAMHMVLGC